jgi:hypothetical protein
VEDESGGQDLDSSSDDIRWLTFAELADELCPQYMSIGVPYSEYWHGDYTQLAHYRKAYELSRDRANHDAWLQGGYIYDALCMVAPMLHAFAKRGTKPMPYHKEPYKLGEAEDSNKDKPPKTDKEIQEIHALNASARFASFMTQWNKQFESKGGDASGNNN